MKGDFYHQVKNTHTTARYKTDTKSHALRKQLDDAITTVIGQCEMWVDN